MLVSRILCVLFFSVCFTTAFSQDSWDFFAGKWNFEIRFVGNTSGKPDLTATWTVKKCLGKNIVCLDGFVTIGGKEFTRELVVYHPERKEYVRTILANNGDFLEFTSPGWEQGKLNWTGKQYSSGKVTELREEIEKTGPASFTAVFYRKSGVDWLETQTETLKRIAN